MVHNLTLFKFTIMNTEYCIVNKNKGASTSTDLTEFSKEELIERIRVLEAHNVQLKNIIDKSAKVPDTKKNNHKSFDFSKCTFRHVLLKILYLGYDYHGYVVQEDTTNTVEYYLFNALVRTCFIKDRSSSNYHRCGRTDKGVSAFGQVVSLRLRSKLKDPNTENASEDFDYCSILNKVLPDNIRCIAWCPINENFSARFDCKSRTYKYYFPKGKLNVEKMKVASQYLLGTHDFRNFCKMDVGNGVVKFIRNILFVDIDKYNTSNCKEREMYVITIRGQAFLWHQIRCIMGVLFLIGEGKEDPQVVKDLLDVEKNPQKPDYSLASEVPLNLYESEYEVDNSQWVYNLDNLRSVIDRLNHTWTMLSTRSTMIENILRDLEELIKGKFDENPPCVENSTPLIKALGSKRKKYVPLMQRQKCDSLEKKVAHFVKKRRIEPANKT